jgi:uncharacterized protein (TIGR03437 family)
VDSAGNTVFATYLGGPTADNAATLAVDTAGEVFVAGTTGGSFPTTANAALVTIPASGTFVAKLNANGSKMIYSTYLPASMATVSAMALDPDGNVYVTGTSSTGHVAVVKLSPDGSAFIYYQELAGSGQDAGTAIAVDAGGNAAIAGSTTSADFPVSAGALQLHLLGAQNGFVAELVAGGNVLFSTYLGGSGSDAASSVQIDAAGNTYVAGSTTSMDLPTTQGVFQPAPMVPMWATSPGGFVAKLVPGGSSLAYASYVMSDAALVLSPYVVPGVAGLAVDSQGEVYLDGVTGAGFSVTASAPQACFGGSRDVFVLHLDAQGGLKQATYFGGPLDDYPFKGALSVAADGTVLLTAESSFGGSYAWTFAQIRFGGLGWTAPACLSPDVLSAATLSDLGLERVSPGQLSTLTGFGIGPETGVAYQPGPQGEPPLSLAGVQVFFDGRPAPVMYAQSRQVNVVAPFELSVLDSPTGLNTTMVSLVYNGTPFGPFAVLLYYANPAFFRLQPGVSTQAAAINQDGSINGPAHPASAGSVVSLFGTGFGQTNPLCATGALNAPIATSFAPGVIVTLNPFAALSPTVLYAGGAPNLLCGMAQVNMVVPSGTPAGNFEVAPLWNLTVGNSSYGVENLLGTTIVVK